MAYQDPFSTQSQPAGRATSAASVDGGLRAYMLRIYNYMASALALTGVVAMGAANSASFQSMLYLQREGQVVGISGMGMLLAIAPLFLVIALSFGIQRMRASTAQALFWAYSVLIGLSLSSIFLVYTGESIARVFFITAGTFGGMSLYGYTTKKDLTGFGSFLMMGLLGVILASLVNMFIGSAGVGFATSVIGVLIFVGLVAYDTQMLRNMYYMVGGGENLAKASIMGALRLYLDFINIFLYLLRFMGEQRR